MNETGPRLSVSPPNAVASAGGTRAITDEAPPAAVPPVGFWERETSHFPAPPSPLTGSLWLSPQQRAARRTCDEAGVMADAVEFRTIGGWMYVGVIPFGGKQAPPLPHWLLFLAVRTLPKVRARIRDCVQAMRSDKFGGFIERWYDSWRPAMLTANEELRAVDPETLSDRELASHLAAIEALIYEAFEIHFLLHGSLCVVLGELAFACRDLLAWSDAQALRLVSGLSRMSSEPGREFARVAALVPTDADSAARAAFEAALRRFLSEYGFRALRYEVAETTLEEEAEVVRRLASRLGDQQVRLEDAERHLLAQRESAAEEARCLLHDRPADLARFERVLARAELGYPVREDNEFFTISMPFALARRAALVAGRRLTSRGCLDEPDAVFLLEVAELRDALATPAQSLHRLVQHRRRQQEHAFATPGPASYGAVPAPPPLGALPTEARFAMKALQWTLDRILAPAPDQEKVSSEHRGVGASPGCYRGPARLVATEADFGKLRLGDVMVCTVTAPVWSFLFPLLGGLVTECGGILAHAAIVAREFDIPAVVGAAGVMQALRDGDMVTVDGSAGVIRRD